MTSLSHVQLAPLKWPSLPHPAPFAKHILSCILYFTIMASLESISQNINYLYMYQNWSQSKLYLEALINDQHEMHIKNIFKTT